MATITINTGSKAFSKEPANGGITESKEKIWSENTGRKTNGTMTGDVIATKTTIAVTYAVMTNSERKALLNAISDAFFTVSYNGNTYTMYAGTPSFPMVDNWDSPRFLGVTVNLIEK